MRKLILQEFVSLDGMVAGPTGSVDFIPGSTQGDLGFGREQLRLMDAVDTLLLGRVTYDMFRGFWPNVSEGPEQEFADKFNALARVIFSKTLERAPWGKWRDGRIVRRDPADEIASLQQQPGKDLLLSGSISVAQALIQADAVDEYRLVLCPVVMPGGRPLFHQREREQSLKLVKATALDRGAVSLVYSRH